MACVRMAIAMLLRMRELRSQWQELGAEHPFQLRIGINTGYCTVGNFGSADRMDYTIIGNMVNMTARLQSHAEVDGVLLGHETYSLVKDVVATEERSPIKVKGFSESIRCYKVVGLYDNLVREGQVIREEQEGFKFMLDLEKRDKQEAITTLEAILVRLRS
jgi:adenylate cyclase